MGSWQTYYEFWHQVTKEEAGEEWLALHPTLQKFAKSENTFDKTTYDAFASGLFRSSIEKANPSALIFSGIETDVCVLGTVLTAVDLGHRTIIAKDAVTSSDIDSHNACFEFLFPAIPSKLKSQQLLKFSQPEKNHDPQSMVDLELRTPCRIIHLASGLQITPLLYAASTDRISLLNPGLRLLLVTALLEMY